MFGLLKLLTLPVSGPLVGGRWVLQTLLDEAERTYYDLSAIREEMAEAERQYQAGQIDELTFERWEETLLQRLLDAKEYHRRKQTQQSE